MGTTERSIWNSEKEDYYFSVVDVISVLTNSNNPRNYWNMLKTRMKEEEQSELSTKCVQLKLQAKDGKLRLTDTLDIEVLLTDLGEIATRDIAKEEKPQGLEENIKVAKKGGQVASDARKSYEKATNRSAITNRNVLEYQYVDNNKQIENK